MDFDPRTEWRPEDWEATRSGLRKAETLRLARRASTAASAVALTVGVGWGMSVVVPDVWQAWTSPVVETLTAWIEGANDARSGTKSLVQSEESASPHDLAPPSEPALPSDPSTASTSNVETPSPEQAGEQSMDNHSFEEHVYELTTGALSDVAAEFPTSNASDQTSEMPVLVERPESRAQVTVQAGVLDVEGVVGTSVESDLEATLRLPVPRALMPLTHGAPSAQGELLGSLQPLAQRVSRRASWHAAVDPVYGSWTGGIHHSKVLAQRVTGEVAVSATWDQTPIQWSAWHPTDAFGSQELRTVQSDGAAVSWVAVSSLAHVSPRVRFGLTARWGVEWTRRMDVGVTDPFTGTWVEGSSVESTWGRVEEASPWRFQPGLRADVAVLEGWWFSAQALREASWRGADHLGVIDVEQQPLWLQIGVAKW